MSDPTQPEDLPTVECEPHSVEDMGISNEAKIVSSESKIDQLLATAITVREELREQAITVKEELRVRSRKIITTLAIAGTAGAVALGVAGGVLWGLREQAEKLTIIAETNRRNGEINRANGEIIKETAVAIRDATSPEAAARGRAATAQAINDIRRSIDCVKLSDEEIYRACVEVVARLDAIRAGLDPFVP